MARSVICLGVFALSLACVAPAVAEQQSGYIAVSKMMIDPNMTMLDDGNGPQAPRASQSGGVDAGVPLDQMGDDGDADAPAGDDPYADNAVETNTVYSL